ncbi:MAG: thioredoxin family protein [Anaerolineae bacterium]
MALLQEKDRQYLIAEFGKIAHPVKLVLFTQDFECQFCRETRMIVEELVELSDKLSAEVYDLVADKEVAEEYGVDKIPAIVVMLGGEQPKDYGIRYFGIPSGYEFSSLVQDIMMIGSGDSGLAPATREMLAALKTPLHLQVFVTPTCPYCPGAVRLAHQMAMESDLVKADMVEATEFPHLSMRYNVMGVPRTVINEQNFVEGMVPEAILVQQIKEALR